MNDILTKQLYTHVIQDENSVQIVLANESHPIFKAHFEGNPLLPAFLQVDIAAEILGLSIKRIGKSKFMEPLLPSDHLLLSHEERLGKTYIKWIKNGKTASEITLEIE